MSKGKSNVQPNTLSPKKNNKVKLFCINYGWWLMSNMSKTYCITHLAYRIADTSKLELNLKDLSKGWGWPSTWVFSKHVEVRCVPSTEPAVRCFKGNSTTLTLESQATETSRTSSLENQLRLAKHHFGGLGWTRAGMHVMDV